MKKCPNCKKDIPSDAKVCPYCGTPQVGYHPMKRTNIGKPNYFIAILAMLVIFSPMFLSFFLTFGALEESSTGEPDKSITLNVYQETENDSVAYQFDSLDAFEKKVSNSGAYVKKIKNVEKELNEVVGENTKVSKDYMIQVTNASNVYFDITYDIQINKQETMSIVLSYDLSGDNECVITHSKKGLKSFDDMKITEDNNYQLLKDVINVFDGQKQHVAFDQASQEFNHLQSQLEDSKDSLSHYGIGISKEKNNKKCSMRILGHEKDYRVRTTYNTQLKMKKFL